MSTDILTFARAWASAPRRTGAILPSGDALAKLITAQITPNTGPVLELGPGTGVFTEALLRRGLRQDGLTLIESAPAFARLLQLRYPQARVLPIDACDLIAARLYEDRPLGAVISGLPLLSLPAETVERTLRGAFAYARPSAGFFQFTYGPFCPVPRPILDRLGLAATHVGWVLRNLPPASVYRIHRG